MKLLDLFSGIGGFHKGFEQAGFKFDWVGHSDIDKYANKLYQDRFKAEELGDVTAIQPRRLPDDITIVCGGFPCQAFSMAGKRKGFDDTRGTLFFEIARILRHYRDVGNPISCFLLENVKGLLSHDNGRTFATIYRVLNNLGYTIEFQLLNTRWWLPQNRERIYIVGYIGDRGGPQVFPIGEDDRIFNNKQTGTKSRTEFYSSITTKEGSRKENNYIVIEPQLKQVGTIGNDSESSRVYDVNGISRSIKNGGGMGAKTGLYRIPAKKIEIIGNLKGEGGHECHNVHSTEGIAPTVRHNHGKTTMVQPVLTPNRAEKRQNGRRFKEDGEDMFTLTQQDQHGVKINSNIRRLTPVECNRLQGFSDDHNKYGIIDDKVVEISDTQRYKQAGNAVTVDVVEAVAKKIKKIIK